MTIGYLVLKFIHIMIAILALGTSAGLGIVQEFYAEDPAHGAYMLRAIARLEAVFVIPGFVLMPVTGLWMANGVWPLSTPWLAASLALGSVGLVLLLGTLGILRRQIQALETAGLDSRTYRRLSLLGRILGGAAGLIVVAIVYLMVVKPELTCFRLR
jgi:uncharacterized membrane protein